eukprot:6872489-Prymnesium_polylepis.1
MVRRSGRPEVRGGGEGYDMWVPDLKTCFSCPPGMALSSGPGPILLGPLGGCRDYSPCPSAVWSP